MINSDDFINNVFTELEIQDPICNLIDLAQKKNINIADGAELWLDLKVPDNLSRKDQECYTNRKEMALNDVVLAAYYIDPFKDKGKLSSSQKSEARSFLSSKLRGNLQNQLLVYESNPVNINEIKEMVDNPVDFWTIAQPHFPDLSKIAFKLLQIPASTAQLERVFSMWQHIHSKTRNRLTFERSKKLMHIYYNLNAVGPTLWHG